MAAALLPGSRFTAFDPNTGAPLAFGSVETYQSGTNTRKETYRDENGNHVNPNPVTLDAAGQADICLQGDYKFIIRDKNGRLIQTIDPIRQNAVSQWVNEVSAEYVSATEVRVFGDQTNEYVVNRRVRVSQGEQPAIQGLVDSASFDGTYTTITLKNLSDPLTVQVSAVATIIITPDMMAGLVINTNTSQGLANTSTGDYFWVYENTALSLYRNNAGSADRLVTLAPDPGFVFSEASGRFAARVQDMPNAISFDYDRDNFNEIYAGYADGTDFVIRHLSPAGVMVDEMRITTGAGCESLVVESNGNGSAPFIWLGMGSNGTFANQKYRIPYAAGTRTVGQITGFIVTAFTANFVRFVRSSEAGRIGIVESDPLTPGSYTVTEREMSDIMSSTDSATQGPVQVTVPSDPTGWSIIQDGFYILSSENAPAPDVFVRRYRMSDGGSSGSPLDLSLLLTGGTLSRARGMTATFNVIGIPALVVAANIDTQRNLLLVTNRDMQIPNESLMGANANIVPIGANWTLTVTGTTLQFRFGAAVLATLTSNGVFTAKGDVVRNTGL